MSDIIVQYMDMGLTEDEALEMARVERVCESYEYAALEAAFLAGE